GTTGAPKLVVRPHLAFTRAARLQADLGLDRLEADRFSDPAERILMVASLTHGMGQYLAVTAVLIAGEMCVTSWIDTNASLEEVKRLDPSYICVTPRVLHSFVKQKTALAASRLFGERARKIARASCRERGEGTGVA